MMQEAMTHKWLIFDRFIISRTFRQTQSIGCKKRSADFKPGPEDITSIPDF